MSFEIDHIDDITLSSDITENHEVYYNKPINLLLSEDSFVEKVPIVFHLKAQNCYIKLELIENEQIISTYNGDFIQFTVNDIKAYKFRATLDHYEDETFKDENGYCSFMTYLFEKTSVRQIIISEGVEHQTKLKSDNKMILFQLPFVYNDQLVKNPFPFYATVKIDNCTKASLKTFIEKQGTYGATTYTVFENDIIPLESKYLTFCTTDEICHYIIEIVTLTPEIESNVNLKLSINWKIPMFVKKNEFHIEAAYNSMSYYYTKVSPGR